MLLRLHDGLEVETVLIPVRGGGNPDSDPITSTLCLSSQVGCAQACRFCATGAMGRRRGLSTGEILAQVFEGNALARAEGLPPVRNIVFMGQGEPLDNSDAVEAALDALTDRARFALAPRRITVSTVGPSPAAIRRMAAWPARLAWSVHAADDELRKQLVPSARFPVAELRDAFLDVLSARRERALANPGRRDAASHQGKTSRTLLIEVTLIDGVNDGPEHAEQMIKLLRPLVSESRHSKVNLIPYNWNPAERLRGDFAKSFRPSPPERVETYRNMIMQAGLMCFTRAERGAAESAACGMLATATRRAARATGSVADSPDAWQSHQQ